MPNDEQDGVREGDARSGMEAGDRATWREPRDARDYAESIVETLHEPLLVLTPDLQVKSANPAFYEHFQVTPEETENELICSS